MRHAFGLPRTRLLTAGLAAFLVGLALASVAQPNVAVFAAIAFVWLLLLWRRQSWLVLGVIVSTGILFGLWRGGDFKRALEPYNALYRQTVTLQVVAAEDAVYGTNSQLSFDAGNIQAVEPIEAKLPGRVKVSGFGEYMVYKGDTVFIKGKLYQTRGGRQGQMSYAVLQTVMSGTGWVDKLRRQFAAGAENALPEPAASFGLGLIIGQRTTLPDDVSKNLAAVGLTHLVAVSGYNLTIIVEATRRATKRGSKYQSILLAAILISLFLLVTGLSASIVRAAIVSTLSLLAWYYGRQFKPLLLIVLAASITACWNPLYVWGDISWYLSFLAFFGVLVIAPAIMRRLYGDREPKMLQAVLIETFSAQIMTVPYVLYIFGQVSIISILSNLIVVPMVPLAMLVCLVAGIAGMVLPLVSGWFAWPAKALLTYMLDIAAVLAKAPHALLHGTLTIPGLVTFYVSILTATTVVWQKYKPKYGILTDETSNSEAKE